MATATAPARAKPVAQREVTITRVFDAPRELVFSMWTDARPNSTPDDSRTRARIRMTR